MCNQWLMITALAMVTFLNRTVVGYEDDWSRLVDSYLKTPDANAENNALVDYIRAYKLCDGAGIQKEMEVIRRTITEGWPAGGDEALMRFLAEGRPVMEAVVAGNAKPALNYPAQMPSINSKLWDSIQVIAIGRLFELDAARKLAEGNALAAVESLGQMMTFASRIVDESSSLISQLIRMSMRRSGAEGFMRIALTAKPEPELCARIMELLDPHLMDDEGVAAAMEMECRTIRVSLENPIELINEIGGNNLDLVLQFQDANQNLELVHHQAEELKELIPPIARGPFDPNGQTKLAEAIRPMHPVVKMMIPNVTEARSRELMTLAQIRLAWLTAAALSQGVSTERPFFRALENVSAQTAAGIDPFVPSRPIRHVVTEPADGASFLIFYSVGPDLADDKGALEFSVSKGKPSPGDILVKVPWNSQSGMPVR